MRIHARLCLLLLPLLVVAGAACSSEEEGPAEEPRAAEPAEVESPEPTGEPTTPPPVEPFDLRLGEVAIVDADNAPILPHEPVGVDEAAAQQAVDAAAETLHAYLDAQFTDRTTWFSDEALERLLPDGARERLTDEDRAGLGVLDLDVEHVQTGEAEVDPMVTMTESSVHTVTLTYRASLVATLSDGTDVPVVQRGHAVFVPDGDGWRVHALDVSLQEGEES